MVWGVAWGRGFLEACSSNAHESICHKGLELHWGVGVVDVVSMCVCWWELRGPVCNIKQRCKVKVSQ